MYKNYPTHKLIEYGNYFNTILPQGEWIKLKIEGVDIELQSRYEEIREELEELETNESLPT